MKTFIIINEPTGRGEGDIEAWIVQGPSIIEALFDYAHMQPRSERAFQLLEDFDIFEGVTQEEIEEDEDYDPDGERYDLSVEVANFDKLNARLLSDYNFDVTHGYHIMEAKDFHLS